MGTSKNRLVSRMSVLYKGGADNSPGWNQMTATRIVRFQLRDFDTTKTLIPAIKAVRAACGLANLSLKDAKDGVEAGELKVPAHKVVEIQNALAPFTDTHWDSEELNLSIQRVQDVSKRLLARGLSRVADMLEWVEGRLK